VPKQISDPFNPSLVEVITATLYPWRKESSEDGIDIRPQIVGFDFEQSIDKTGITGTIRLHDRVGILEGIMRDTENNTNMLKPLRGEERLQWKMKGFDYGTEVDLDLFVYRIDNITPTTNVDGKEFSLHVMSWPAWYAVTSTVLEPFKNKKGHEIVKKIFDDYVSPLTNSSFENETPPAVFPTDVYRIKDTGDWTDRSLVVQHTEGLFNVIIPSYNVPQAMNFIAKKSYSSKSPSCMYRFFETWDNFYFVTDEWLILFANQNEDNIISLTYNPYVSKDGRAAEEQVKAIESLSYTKRTDSIDDLYSGGYVNQVMEIDLIDGDIIYKDFDDLFDEGFYGMNGERLTKLTNEEFDIHTETFILDNYRVDNKPKFMVIKDWLDSSSGQTTRGNQFFAEVASRRLAYHHRINRTPLAVSLKGRLDITAGQIVDLTIDDMSSVNKATEKQNDQLRGKYLVSSVYTKFDNNILTTNLTLIKYNWSV